jgi:S-(hydroxymethyl)glutathione synthase
MTAISTHPAVDHGVTPGAEGFAGGTLVCHCATEKVEVKIDSN